VLRRFEQMVQEQRKSGRRCLLVVDEVQNLSLAALEELRMLSNITVDGRASVQTILLGQPQFRSVLARSDVEQLRQRVLASYHLGPLTEQETRLYIEHRLRTVGWSDNPGWEEDALRSVHRATGGIPRRINTLCSRVLLYGALEEVHVITRDMVDTTAGELQHDLGAGLALPDPVPEPDHPRIPLDQLLLRIEMLEEKISRQDRMFRKMLDLLGSAEAHRT